MIAGHECWAKNSFYKKILFFVKKIHPKFFVQNFALWNARTSQIERQKLHFYFLLLFLQFFCFYFFMADILFPLPKLDGVWYISNVNIENINLHIDIQSVNPPKSLFQNVRAVNNMQLISWPTFNWHILNLFLLFWSGNLTFQLTFL